jgi:two-component system OmpR family response regulator
MSTATVTAAAAATTSPPRLLVADDEPNIRELLAASLRFAGFDVTTAADGPEALAEARSGRPDLLVLDVMMPGVDGLQVVQRLRQEGSRSPVLFLTARDTTEDKVTGLTVGGDDYVTKPFSLDEVVARVRALLRRAGSERTTDESGRLVYADLEMDTDTHEVRKAGESVALTPTEYKLLRYFLLNPNRVLSKAQILDHVWNYDFGGDSNVVESYVSYLRKKVDLSEPRLLHTLRGVGYILRLQP